MRYLIFLFPLQIFAQDHQYQLRGSFPFYDNQLPTASIVNFDLRWNEVNGRITGQYLDNYFQLSSHDVSGESNSKGRSVEVRLPEATSGVYSLKFITQQTGLQSGEIGTKVLLKDQIGNIKTTRNISATMMAATSEDTEATNNVCTIGFGSLTGYCGLYAGTFNESEDNLSKCDLRAPNSEVRLELATDTSLNIYPRFKDSIINSLKHEIGKLPSSPLEQSISVSRRICGPIDGTTMNPETCKKLTLEGNFTTFNEERSFSGNYTIRDDANLEVCRFQLRMTREQSY